MRFILILIAFFSLATHAAEGDATSGSLNAKQMSSMHEFAVSGGTFLPYGIFGVRSTYRGWSMRYARDFGFVRPQLGFHAFNTRGVTYYMGSLSIGEIYQLGDVPVSFYAGFTANYYKPRRTTSRTFDFVLVNGFHLGGAPLIRIIDDLYFRADFQMGFNPGTNLYVGLGLSYWFK